MHVCTLRPPHAYVYFSRHHDIRSNNKFDYTRNKTHVCSVTSVSQLTHFNIHLQEYIYSDIIYIIIDGYICSKLYMRGYINIYVRVYIYDSPPLYTVSQPLIPSCHSI